MSLISRFTNTYPRGFFIIFITFMLFMAGAATMQGLVVLYLTNGLHYTDGSAYSLFTAYLSIQFALAVYGGYLGGRMIEHHHAVALGLLFTAIGLLFVALKHAVLLRLGLCFYAFGAGFVVPNAFYLLGRLYALDDHRRDTGFTIIYTGMNLGSLLGFGLSGVIAATLSYSAAFYLFSFVALFAFIVFIFKFDLLMFSLDRQAIPLINKIIGLLVTVILMGVVLILLRHDVICRFILIALGVIIFLFLLFLSIKMRASNRRASNNLILFLILSMLALVFWAIYYLEPTVIILFIEHNVNRHVLGYVIPAPSILSLNTIYMIFLGVFLGYLWLRLSNKKKRVHLISRFSWALFSMGISLLLLYFGIRAAGFNSIVHLGWVAMYFLFFSVGEVVLAPANYKMASELIVEKWQSFMLGLIRLTMGVAVALSGELAQFFTVKHGPENLLMTNKMYASQFLLYGVVAMIIALVSILCVKSYTVVLRVKR